MNSEQKLPNVFVIISILLILVVTLMILLAPLAEYPVGGMLIIYIGVPLLMLAELFLLFSVFSS